MDPATRQQLVERVWLLEQLRDEARARAHDATREAQRARESAAEAGERAAGLHDRAASIGDELADLRDELGHSSEADDERAEARMGHEQAARERAPQGE
jgi:hypothetical protein